jgi:hypothetical protein
MRASRVLQKCLADSFRSMHLTRSRVLMRAVEALLSGRRLTLMDIARSWPGAERVRAPLKAVNRLLSNPRLHAERTQAYAGMAHWLLRSEQPVIVVDWSDLKPDKSWGLLRAAVPVGGRTLPILDMVFPGGQSGTPKAEKLFLLQLQKIVPKGDADPGHRCGVPCALVSCGRCHGLALAGALAPSHTGEAGGRTRQERLGAFAGVVRAAGGLWNARHGPHGHRS